MVSGTAVRNADEALPRAVWTECRAVLTAAGIENAGQELDWMWENVFGQGRHLTDPAAPLPPQEVSRLRQMVEQRAQHRPLQYLLGSWPFLDFELRVAPGVLIPRADTECVALHAVECGRRFFDKAQRDGEASAGAASENGPSVTPSADEALRCIDLCAGSGAIALALAVRLGRPVTAVELSDAALPLLRENVRRVCAKAAVPSVTVVQADIFAYQETLPDGCVGLLTANPPYLTAQEMSALQPEVAFEPAMALDGGADGLDFYRHIVTAYRRCMAPGGTLVLEIGETQGTAVCTLLTENGWQDVRLLQDAAGLDRCVSAVRRG